MEDRRAIDLLFPALRWRYQTARQRAVKLLERVGPPAVPRLLRTLQGAETATERGGAAEALDLIPDSRSVPRLIRALKDPGMVVRRFAMVALLRLEAMDAIPHVVRLLEDESGGVGMTLCDEIHRAYDQMAVGPVQIGELPEWIRIHGKVAWYVYAGSHRDIGERLADLHAKGPIRQGATPRAAGRRIRLRS